jgi:hypothetical protein
MQNVHRGQKILSRSQSREADHDRVTKAEIPLNLYRHIPFRFQGEKLLAQRREN